MSETTITNRSMEEHVVMHTQDGTVIEQTVATTVLRNQYLVECQECGWRLPAPHTRPGAALEAFRRLHTEHGHA